MDEQVFEFLTHCKLQANNVQQLDGLLIFRDALLSSTIYNAIQGDIPQLKTKFSSSSLTSLHKSALKNQKWPLLNLVRQILRVCHYKMVPIRKSDGYTLDKKKKYKRYFKISKIITQTPATMNNNITKEYINTITQHIENS